jgi:hypothetical protein
MLSAVLVATGSFLAVCGCLRGYAAARAALAPMLREGDQTRTLVDATLPLLARTRIRVAARNVAMAMAWVAVSLYGLYLGTIGFGIRP